MSVHWGLRSQNRFRREVVNCVRQEKMARPGREQPNLERLALKGLRIRVNS